MFLFLERSPSSANTQRPRKQQAEDVRDAKSGPEVVKHALDPGLQIEERHILWTVSVAYLPQPIAKRGNSDALRLLELAREYTYLRFGFPLPGEFFMSSPQVIPMNLR